MAGYTKGPTIRIKKPKVSKKTQVQISSKGKIKLPRPGA